VSTGNQQLEDPLGATTSIPFATPSTAIPPAEPQAISSAPAGGIALLDRMAPDSRRRPDPEAGTALAGIGGAVLAVGLLTLIGDAGTEGSARGRLAIFSVIVFGVALAGRLLVTAQKDVRAAAVGAGAVGLAGVVTSITWTNAGKGWAYLLLALAFLAAWALPGFFGRSLFLGAGALSLVAALGQATSSSGSRLSNDVGAGRYVGGQGAVFLIAAIALLALVFLLDRKGYRGTATALIIPALISTAVGIGDVVSKSGQTGGSLLVILAGVVLALVGGYGERRATTWVGAAVASVGVVAFFFAVIKPDSVSKYSTMLLISGALLIVVPIVVEAVRRSRARSTPHFDPPTATS
jgi:hypothetical protein